MTEINKNSNETERKTEKRYTEEKETDEWT